MDPVTEWSESLPGSVQGLMVDVEADQNTTRCSAVENHAGVAGTAEGAIDDDRAVAKGEVLETFVEEDGAVIEFVAHESGAPPVFALQAGRISGSGVAGVPQDI